MSHSWHDPTILDNPNVHDIWLVYTWFPTHMPILKIVLLHIQTDHYRTPGNTVRSTTSCLNNQETNSWPNICYLHLDPCSTYHTNKGKIVHRYLLKVGAIWFNKFAFSNHVLSFIQSLLADTIWTSHAKQSDSHTDVLVLFVSSSIEMSLLLAMHSIPSPWHVGTPSRKLLDWCGPGGCSQSLTIMLSPKRLFVILLLLLFLTRMKGCCLPVYFEHSGFQVYHIHKYLSICVIFLHLLWLAQEPWSSPFVH